MQKLRLQSQHSRFEVEDIVEWFDGYGIAKAAQSMPLLVERRSRLVEWMGSPVKRRRYDPVVQADQVLARLQTLGRSLAAEAGEAHTTVAESAIVMKTPFAGRVEGLRFEVGDTIPSGSVLCSVVDGKTTIVPIQLPAIVFDYVRLGAPGRMTASSRPGIVWEGAVSKIDPVTRSSRSFTVHVEVENDLQAEPLPPGTRVDGRISGPVQRSSMVLPRSVCLGDRVFIVQNGVARSCSISIERFIGDRAVVSGGVSPGDLVIAAPLTHIADGVPVQTESHPRTP